MVMRPSDREIASQFAVLFAAIKELITPAEPTKKRRGDTIEWAWIGTHNEFDKLFG
jgi:hypothetical protein